MHDICVTTVYDDSITPSSKGIFAAKGMICRKM